ncbi:MAG: hypothetical protein QHH17_05315 [Candidatus Bathyarchaeota archaeon]|nr:hypothetical protein [Candidatus Bathyarchaeota archaeon]
MKSGKEDVKILKILLLVFLFIAALILGFIMAGEVASLFFPEHIGIAAPLILIINLVLDIAIFTFAFIKISKE